VLPCFSYRACERQGRGLGSVVAHGPRDGEARGRAELVQGRWAEREKGYAEWARRPDGLVSEGKEKE
jgi:hypothetical protein